MRIFDQQNHKELGSVTLMLTSNEAKELSGLIKSLDPSVGDHIHVSDIDSMREITVLIYRPDNLHYFTKEVQDVIQNDSDLIY